MSIYLMTVGELAKKRGEPVGEFVKKINEAGFYAGSHLKKLTQDDLDQISELLQPTKEKAKVEAKAEKKEVIVTNPNVIIVKRDKGKSLVAFIDVTEKDGELVVSVVESSVEDSLGETLLEFRKLQGLKMGVN